MFYHYFPIIFAQIYLVTSVAIDNHVDGIPRVYCFQNGLKLAFKTEKPFKGHVYVKGMYGNAQCNRNYTGETATPALSIAYEDCIHQRERMAQPPGMSFMLEVIVQFHAFFTTKVDRAFIVTCMYREAINTVTQNQVLQGNVNGNDEDSIPVTRVSFSPQIPTCFYSIHRDSPTGPSVSFARIGEKLYHKWQCQPSEDGEFHGILIHSCVARDGRGGKVMLLDKKGCTLDHFSMPTPTYTLNLTMAYVEIHAFKFADDLQISFGCAITMCLTMNNRCQGITPPNCESRNGSSQVTTTSPISGPGQGASPGSGRPGTLGPNGYGNGNNGGGAATPSKSVNQYTAQPYNPSNQNGASPSVAPNQYNTGITAGGVNGAVYPNGIATRKVEGAVYPNNNGAASQQYPGRRQRPPQSEVPITSLDARLRELINSRIQTPTRTTNRPVRTKAPFDPENEQESGWGFINFETVLQPQPFGPVPIGLEAPPFKQLRDHPIELRRSAVIEAVEDDEDIMIDVTADDFVVFDKESTVASEFENLTMVDSTRIIHKTGEICLTMIAFAQILVALAVLFTALLILALYVQRRTKKVNRSSKT